MFDVKWPGNIIKIAYNRPVTVVATVMLYICLLVLLTFDPLRVVTMEVTTCPLRIEDEARVFPNVTKRKVCPEREVHLSQRLLPVTALASVHGSGNSWTRHLLQQATGIGTSAIYCSNSLHCHGYPFECDHDHYDRVSVVKTHEYGKWSTTHFDRAVVIIRNPFEFIVSSFHDHLNQVLEEEAFSTKKWRKHIPNHLRWWVNFNYYWLKDFEGPVHPVLYHKLKQDLKSELKSLLTFLNIRVSEAELNCTLVNKEGNFHRPSQPLRNVMDFYTEEEKAQINDEIIKMKTFLKEKLYVEW